MLNKDGTLNKGKYKGKSLDEVYKVDKRYIEKFLYGIAIGGSKVDHELRYAIEELMGI